MKHNTWRRVLALCLTLAMLCGVLPAGILTASAEEPETEALYPYQDTSYSFEERAADLVSRMTLEEKISQLYDGRNPDAAAIPRLGIRQYRWWSEALHGVARDGVATSFPTGLGIASTWDRDLVEQITDATGDEARDKFNSRENSHGLAYWSPTINMSRDPRWGRAEEAYGEDPYLTGEIAEAFINGLQGANDPLDASGEYLKAIATPKHFLGNNSESNRHSGSSNIDERDLREYYTYAFKNAIENGNAESIMTSYNAVNGVPVSVSTDLLDTLLRRTWGFDGYVTTDCDTLTDVMNNHSWRPEDFDGTWDAKTVVAYAVKAGIDANCGSTVGNNAKAAIEAGLLTEDDIDKILVRLFTARMKTGEFDPDGGPFGSIEDDIANRTYQQLAEDSSDQAVVLLKNDGILPLGTTGQIKSLVLVGDRADKLELGDYSTYSPYGTSTALQGIQAAYERYCEENSIEGSFRFIAGASTTSTGNYLMNVKDPQLCGADGNVLRSVDWNTNSGINNCKVESAGNLGYMGKSEVWVKFDQVDFTNVKTVKVDMAGDTNACKTTMEIRIGSPTGQLVGIMNQGVGYSGGWGSYQTYTFDYTGAAGGYDTVLEDVYFVFSETKSASSGYTEDEQAAIAAADVVVFFAGTRQGENGYFENTDGYNLNLPNSQSDKIEGVAELNPNTVVYIQAVSQVNIEPFKDKVKGIFWSTYNGQAQGNAAGRLLFGERNPSAKLVFSWYTDINDLANVTDYQLRADEDNNGRTYQYFTGNVTYPFGYGLSYSTFEYANLTLSKTSVTPDDTITVEFDVTNTSKVDGQEVAELYVVSPDAAANDRPAKRLKGFDKKEIKAGQTVHFSIDLPVSDLWFWDADADIQTYDQGVYSVQVGADSKACEAMTANFTLTGQLTKVLNVVTAAPSGHMLDASVPTKTIATDLSACYNDQTFVELSKATVTYTSSKPNVASVDENGVVTAVGGGVATITASVTVNGVTVSDSYPVVVSESLAAAGITLNGKAFSSFDPSTTEYSVQVSSFDALPEVAATAAEGVTVSVKQATKTNPVATVTLTKGEVSKIYTITFCQALRSFDFTKATEEDLLSTWGIIRENSSNWALSSSGLTITTEMGDLYNSTNTAKNMFYQDAGSGDWEVEAVVELDQVPSQNYQQVAVIAYQDDGNYLKLGYQGSGKKIQINYESGGSFRDQAPFSSGSMDTTKLWLRLKKAGSDFTGFYSTDGITYTELGTQSLSLSNVKIVLTANNGTKDPGPIKATFKTFTVLSDIVEADFKGLSQLPTGWSVYNPTDGGVEFTENGAVIHTGFTDGADKVENQLQYDVPLEGNWIAETHFTTSRPLQGNWEKFGMFFLTQDGKSYMCLDEEHDGSASLQLVAWLAEGIQHDSQKIAASGITDVYFRLKYVDGTFEMYYSFDGEDWSYLGAETIQDDRFSEGTLRLFATSQRTNNSSFDATVEYCRITKLPGSEEQWTINVTDNGVCDVTYAANPEGTKDNTVSDGGTVTFTVTPRAGKAIGAGSITLDGITGQVTKTKGADGVWTVTVQQVKSDITLTVSEIVAATSISADGVAIHGFDGSTLEYTVYGKEVPVISANAPEGCTVTVEQATAEKPTAKVTVARGSVSTVYTIHVDLIPDVPHIGNPYLPLWEHIPDGEPRVFEDPDNPGKYRVYIYGSHDNQNNSTYCGYDLVVWSAPVEDLTDWRYEGVSYNCGGLQYAPDVVKKGDTYYLYTYDLTHGNSVATSAYPGGPFEGHTRTSIGADPAILVDDDGRVYAYWGYQTLYQAELNEDMTSIKAGTQTANPISNCNQEGVFQYYEGASIRKVDGMYVLVYCQKPDKDPENGVIHDNYRARLVYAYSTNPLGPWTYGGTIIDNGGELLEDGTMSYPDGNVHGGIMEVNGQWYIFYHRMTNNSEFSRQAMAEPIEVRVEGEGENRKVVIEQAEMTSQGFSTEGLDAYTKLEAGIACYLTGGAYITTGYRANPDYNPIVNIKNGVVAGYKYLDFGSGALEGKTLKLAVDLKAKGEAGTIEIYIDKPNAADGTLIGILPVGAGAGDYQTAETSLSNVTGKHAVYFVFKASGSGEICEINKFQFFNDGEIGAVTGITLNKNSLVLETGVQETLTATVLPENGADVTWTSSNEAVATVDEQGTVTAVSTGTAVITAAAGGKTASCSVKVRKAGLQSFDFTEAASKDDVLLVWDVIRENAANWTVDANGGGMTITTQYGDLWSYVNNAPNMFFQDAPGDWCVEMAAELDQVPSLNYQQVAIIAYEDDANYLKIGYQGFTNGTPKVEINSEVDGSFGSATASVPYSGTKIWFRLQKEGNAYTAWYSTDGETYTKLGAKNMDLSNVKLILTANNGTGVNTPIQATFKYFKVLADKTALDALYNACKDQTNDNFTDESWAAFQAALDNAKSVLDDADAAQEEADAAQAALENAFKGLTGKPVTPPVDKSALQALYDANKNKAQGNYTDESWNVFQIALSNANRVLSKEDATQAEVNNAKNVLQAALDGLVPQGSASCRHAHTEYRNAALPTLLTPGYSGDLYCLDCGELLEEGHEIPPTGIFVSGGRPAFVKPDGVILPFTDVKPGDWFYTDVQFVYGNDLMNGTSATAFSPSLTLTRGMIVTILYRMEGEPVTRYNGIFSDVTNYQWYTNAVEWAAKKNIVTGYPDGRFGPEDPVTREQLAAILYRYAEYKGEAVTGNANLSGYTDSTAVSAYAVPAMQWAVSAGLINGSNHRLLPKNSATRAEAAAMLTRFCEKIG